jgi:hypothetical protein
MPAGNITIADPTNAMAGEILIFIIVQDSIGLRTITWGAHYFKNVTLSVGANLRDTVTFVFGGTNWNQISSTLAIS